jgi:hypothetical protein
MSKQIVIRLIAVAIAMIGVVFLLRSTAWGFQARNRLIMQAGGLSGDQLTIATTGPVTAYRTLGALLVGIGLFRALTPPRPNKHQAEP